MTPSSKAMVMDDFLMGFMQQAAREGLLKTDQGQLEYYSSIPISEDVVQRALALLVLYDCILLPGMTGDDAPSVVRLEDEGIVRRLPDKSEALAKLSVTGWGKKRDFAWLGQYLRSHEPILPMIVDRLMLLEDELPADNQFFRPLSKHIPLRRDQFFDALIRYASSLMLNDTLGIETNALALCLAPNFLFEIREEVLNRNRPLGEQSFTDFVLFGAILQIDALAQASELSYNDNVVVATKFSGKALLQNTESISQPNDFAEMLCLVRYSMFSKHHCSAKIESIGHAVKLRNDPNLKSFKEQLHKYRSHVLAGEIVDAATIEKDLVRAQKLMEESTAARIPLDWNTYVGMPLSILTALLSSNPAMLMLVSITSAVLSAVGTGGTKTANETFEENRWILLSR